MPTTRAKLTTPRPQLTVFALSVCNTATGGTINHCLSSPQRALASAFDDVVRWLDLLYGADCHSIWGLIGVMQARYIGPSCADREGQLYWPNDIEFCPDDGDVFGIARMAQDNFQVTSLELYNGIKSLYGAMGRDVAA